MTDVAIQTTVDNAPAVGQAGMLYDSSLHKDVISCRAASDIPYGAVVKITGSDCALPASSNDVTTGDVGVALHTQEHATGDGYKQGDIVSVMRAGRVWILSETAQVDQTSPYVRFTANTAPTRPIGGLLNSADSGKAVQRPGLMITRACTGAGLCVLQLAGVTP